MIVDLAEGGTDIAPDRPVLIHLAPLPPRRNGIADYAASILRRLAPHYQLVCVVTDPAAVDPLYHQIAQVISHQDYLLLADDLAAERHICHIGNNDDHVPILDALSRVPAVVVVHDLTLHYMMGRWAQATLGDGGQMTEVVRLLHGGLAAGLAETKLRQGRPLQSIYTEVNCLPFFRDTARALITHSHYGHVLLRAAGVAAPVEVIPHFAEIPPEAERMQQRAIWRRRFGVAEDTVLFLSLGFVIPNKQIAAALRALAVLPAGIGDWRYVIAGEDRDPAVRETCHALGLEDRVVFLDYLHEADFDAVLAAGDVLVNLRYPTSGETSGTVCRALALGLPCLVSDHGWYAELPDAVTYKVRPSAAPAAALAFGLKLALCDPELRARKATAARDHARDHLAIDHVVARYRSVIETAYAELPPAAAPAVAPGPMLDVDLLRLDPPLPPPLLAAPRPEDLLCAALRAERAHLAGRLLPAQVLPGAFDLAGLVAPTAGDPATAGPRQIFAALRIEAQMIGGLVLQITDAAAGMAPGDLLSLALLTATTDPGYPPGRCIAAARRLPVEDGLGDLVGRCLAGCGFVELRRAEIPVPPMTAQDGYLRILTVTARKLGAAKAEFPFFTQD